MVLMIMKVFIKTFVHGFHYIAQNGGLCGDDFEWGLKTC